MGRPKCYFCGKRIEPSVGMYAYFRGKVVCSLCQQRSCFWDWLFGGKGNKKMHRRYW